MSDENLKSSHYVLVTRPQTQAADFADKVTAFGGVPVLCPLLDIVPVSCNLDSFPLPDAIAITSRQIFTDGICSGLPRFADIPVYCVGEKTAEDAKTAGFSRVVAAKGDVLSLSERLRRDIPSSKSILYLRGEDVRADLSGLLPDHHVLDRVVYKAQALSTLPQDVIDLFPELSVICLFSPRSGAILKDLVLKEGFQNNLRDINLLSLSKAVLESVSDLKWKSSRVAAHPDVRSMISALAEVINDGRNLKDDDRSTGL